MKREQKQLRQQKAAQEQRARANTEARQLRQLQAEQAAAEAKRGQAEYIEKIRGKIRGNITLPPGIQGNPQAEFEVTQLPSGEVLEVKLRRSSGNAALDAAVERAIHKSSPLPKPAKPELFERVLKIPYKPRDD
ncbi:MAG: cell envelope integrity protein TolA [Candidatus Accumulibacter sp.]|nr:cell envelope integrity protein TolA [Accumulibacter sp.]